MKKSVILMCAVLTLGIFAAGALAQPQGKTPASEGWPAGQMYDPKTVETLEGKVEAVEKITAGRMDIPARILLKLKTAKETITVYLGPEWYQEQQGLKLAVGDYLQVRGSRITMDNKPLILPNEVIKNNKAVKFWDEQGRPLWRGPGPKAGQK
ncbi:MAG: DNA-binding protein [Desulfobaccales bacterium]